MALRKETKKKHGDHDSGPKHPNRPQPKDKKPKYPQSAEKLPTLPDSLGSGGSINPPPGPTEPRDPRPEVHDDSEYYDDPLNLEKRAERASKLRRAKLLREQPDFGPCSHATVAAVVGLFGYTNYDVEPARRRPGTISLTFAEATEALVTAAETVRDHARQIIDDAVGRCGSNGQMSGTEQQWWQQFRRLFL